MGRLGNQMFQFASTVGVARKKGYEARFPIENCFRYQGSGPFDPKSKTNMLVKCDLLECFNIDPAYFIPERHISFDKNYFESIFGYNNEIESIQDNTCLQGYFQTEKYFLHCQKEILSQFSFKEHILRSAENYIGNIISDNKNAILVSIHVRRGDYVMFPEHHPTCSKEYYMNALKNFSDIEKIKYVVFSDDAEWCKSEFSDQRFIICDIGDPYTELCAMSLCDHHIIANSSFSWWGAWLNKSHDKKVISPSKWFGPAIQKDTSDVYCRGWKKI